MRRGKAVRRVAAVLPAILAPRMRSHGRCVAATRVGLAALRQLGVEAEPLPVHVSAYNPIFIQWLQEGCPGGTEEFDRRGCYWLTTKHRDGAPTRPPSRPMVGRPWHGHLVVLVPGEVPELVDFDARQLARPEFGLRVPDVLIAPWGDCCASIESADDGAVLYEPLLGADGEPDHAYLTAKDWTEEMPDMVDAVVRAAKRTRL